MAFQQFIVSDTNPNDQRGGGGCVCDERRLTDREGPFVVCYAREMVDELSPHVVVCAGCVRKMAEMVDGEVARVGERGVSLPHVPPTPRQPVKYDGPRGVVIQDPNAESEVLEPDTDE